MANRYMGKTAFIWLVQTTILSSGNSGIINGYSRDSCSNYLTTNYRVRNIVPELVLLIIDLQNVFSQMLFWNVFLVRYVSWEWGGGGGGWGVYFSYDTNQKTYRMYQARSFNLTGFFWKFSHRVRIQRVLS